MYTVSSLFLMEVIDDQYSSTLSTFGSSVYFYLLTFLSLASLPVFYSSGPIELGDISSSPLSPKSDQGPICAAKVKSDS